jgi:DNA-binding response OmpR family regulator
MDGQKRTILVADDDEGVVSMYTTAFESAGYRVMAARTGEEALRLLGTGGVHLAIVDVLIPKKNGFEVLSTVRQNSWGRDLPVILISGVFKARHHRTTVMHRYNVIEYLDKPVEIDALITLVDKVFSSDGEALRSPSNLPPSLQSARKWMKESKPTPSVPLERGADSNLATEQSDVESEAKAARAAPAQSAKVGLAGDLQKTPFPFVLGHVVRKKLSGAMLVERDEIKKIIYFRQGNPFLIKSNLVSECLGKLLVRERIISLAECDESLRRMKSSGKPQGETLVEMGSITAGNLRFALMLQMETKLFDVFSWTRGNYRLNPSARLPPAITELDWKSLGIVVEGLARTYDVARAQNELNEWLHRTVALRRDYKDDLPQLELAEDVEAFVASIEPASVAEIIRKSQLEEADTYRVLYALLATGVLVPVQGG